MSEDAHGRTASPDGAGQPGPTPTPVAAAQPEEPHWVHEEPQRVTLQRSMRSGPAAAGGAIALLAVAAVASTALGALGAAAPQPVATATPTRATLSASAPQASQAPTSGMLTIAPVTSSPSPSRSRTSTSTTKTPKTTTPKTTTSSYGDVSAPGARECARSGSGAFSAVAAGNQATSCEFAVSVWSAYNGANARGARAVLSVADGKVVCSGSQPAVCSGSGGRVLIYGGKLVG